MWSRSRGTSSIFYCLTQEHAIPRIGYHIDPFGHSATQAQIFADIGMDAFVINRIDFADKDKRIDVRLSVISKEYLLLSKWNTEGVGLCRSLFSGNFELRK